MKYQRAYIWPNAGSYYALEYPSQRRICRRARLRDAMRVAHKRGFAVRTYEGFGSTLHYPNGKKVSSGIKI